MKQWVLSKNPQQNQLQQWYILCMCREKMNQLQSLHFFLCVTSLMSFKSSAILQALVSDCHNLLTILQILIL
jgi:hypothetical protein